MPAWKQPRFLIVNADDFGQSPGVNRGVMEAYEHGIVTSASLMVRWPAAKEAAAYSRRHPSLSVGLHFDFGEWACRRGRWIKLYEVVPENDSRAVAQEAARQLAAFRRLLDRDPTHLDSHQHAHRARAVRPIFEEMADKLGVPLRSCTASVRYCGSFYGQGPNGVPLPRFIRVAALRRIFQELPPGWTELGCHPGRGNDLDTMYLRERELEVRTLCAPTVREAIGALGVELCSFRDFAARTRAARPASASRSR